MSSPVEEEEIESEHEGPELDKLPMNESRRFLIKVRMIVRKTIRDLFGVRFSNRHGHWLDRHMSHLVRKYGYWLDYPDGHHVLKGHSIKLFTAAVSTDGRFLFVGGYGGIIIVWDLLGQSMLKQFEVSDKLITCLNYERDLLVSGADDSKIRILNGITHELVHTLEGHSGTVYCLQFNQRCTQLVSGAADRLVKIWCSKTGDCLATLTGHTNYVRSAHFMDNDTKVISGSLDATIELWSVSDKSECDIITDGIKGRIFDMRVNSDSSLIACCFQFNGLTIYNWPSMDIVRSVKVTSWQCRFHPSNPDIIAVTDAPSKSVNIYNVRSGVLIAEWKGHTKQQTGLCWSRDGYRLVSVSLDTTARVWDCAALYE